MLYVVAAFLLLKLLLDLRRNKLMADNNSALAQITTAVNDAVKAIEDLAAKAAAGQDVSGPLTALATTLQSAVTAAGEPVTPLS